MNIELPEEWTPVEVTGDPHVLLAAVRHHDDEGFTPNLTVTAASLEDGQSLAGFAARAVTDDSGAEITELGRVEGAGRLTLALGLPDGLGQLVCLLAAGTPDAPGLYSFTLTASADQMDALAPELQAVVGSLSAQ